MFIFMYSMSSVSPCFPNLRVSSTFWEIHLFAQSPRTKSGDQYHSNDCKLNLKLLPAAGLVGTKIEWRGKQGWYSICAFLPASLKHHQVSQYCF